MINNNNNNKAINNRQIILKKSTIPSAISRNMVGKSRVHVKTLSDLLTYVNFINMIISNNFTFNEDVILDSISVLLKVSVFRMTEWRKIHQKIFKEHHNNPQLVKFFDKPDTPLKTVLAALNRETKPKEMIPLPSHITSLSSLSSSSSLSSLSSSTLPSSSSSSSICSSDGFDDLDFDLFPILEIQ